MAAGSRYFFLPSLRAQLASEIAAQFARFRQTGLTLDHLNGHLHLHLHPTVLSILTDGALDFGFRHLRLTTEPFWLDTRLAGGRWGYRVSHALIFGWLARRARPVLRARGVRHAERVFGLFQDGRVDEAYVVSLLRRLPPGDSELYSHPSLDESGHEFEALVSPRVRAVLEGERIQLIRYQDI